MIFFARRVLWLTLFSLASLCTLGKLAAQDSREPPNDAAAHGARSADLRLPEDAVTKGRVLLPNRQRLLYTAQAGMLAVGRTDAEDLEIYALDKPTGSSGWAVSMCSPISQP